MTRKILGYLIGGCLGLLAIALVATPVAAQPRAYVSNRGSNSVSVIDTTTNTVKATLDLTPGVGPRPVAITPNGRFVYVANHGSDPNTVSVIDTADDTVKATITVGRGPTRVGFSINSACAYAVNEGSNNISVIDTTSTPPMVVATVDTGLAPRGGVIAPHGRTAVLLNQGSNDVWVYDLTADPCNPTPPPPEAKIPLPDGTSPEIAHITTDGLYLYVLGVGSDVVVIDMTNLVVLTTVSLGVGEQPSGADLNQNSHFLYVTSGVSDSVFVIDTDPARDTFNQIVDTIHVGNGPLFGGAFRPDGGLFVLLNAQAQLLEIDTDPQSPTYKTVVCTLLLPGLTNDEGGAFTRNGATLYLTHRLANEVRAIDVSGCSVAADIRVGTNPTRLAVTP